MDAEIKEKLEKMAKKYSEMKEKDFYLAGNAPVTLIRINSTKLNAYRAGFEAAWSLAVEWERKRCAEIVISRHGNFGVKTANLILTPEEVKSE